LKKKILVQDINCRRPGSKPEVHLELEMELYEAAAERQTNGYGISKEK
jgi:hypothetical protein